MLLVVPETEATVPSTPSAPSTPGAPSAPLGEGRAGWLRPAIIIAAAGALAALIAAAADPPSAGAAAGQDWPPFVLVSALLVIGLVADGDGLFAAAGNRLARLSRSGAVLFSGSALVVAAVTAVLNLDTSVAFLTPVLVYTARSRRLPAGALLYGCVLLSNAGSLLLPGSNLTNLIVLGQTHLTGGQFVTRLWPAWLVALAVTALTVALFERRALRAGGELVDDHPRMIVGTGLAAVVAAAVLVVVLRSPALPVAVVAAVAACIRLLQRRVAARRLVEVLGAPVLCGLFGLAVALGTAGRAWSGPAAALAHSGEWGTTGIAAAASVLINNLPAASLLAARPPVHPFALLVGLDLGPNLFVSGSLAWLIWLRVARGVGAEPSIKRATLIGAVAAPASMALALLALTVTSAR